MLPSGGLYLLNTVVTLAATCRDARHVYGPLSRKGPSVCAALQSGPSRKPAHVRDAAQ